MYIFKKKYILDSIMRCIICDNKLKAVIPDASVRGGIRPCLKCQKEIDAASLKDNLLGYDESDPTDDIKETIKLKE